MLYREINAVCSQMQTKHIIFNRTSTEHNPPPPNSCSRTAFHSMQHATRYITTLYSNPPYISNPSSYFTTHFIFIFSITDIVKLCAVRCVITFNIYWILIDGKTHGSPEDGFLEAEKCSHPKISYWHLCYFISVNIQTCTWCNFCRRLCSCGPVKDLHTQGYEYLATSALPSGCYLPNLWPEEAADCLNAVWTACSISACLMYWCCVNVGNGFLLLVVCGYIGWCWYCNENEQTESRPYLRTGHRIPDHGGKFPGEGILKKCLDWSIACKKNGLSTRDKFKADL
jgi:hypothetical protein